MAIYFESERADVPSIDEKKISTWIEMIVKNHDRELGDITYIFCNDDYILKINNEYLNHDYYTDIITFNYNEDNIVSGDIFISIDTVMSNSQKYNTLFSEELHRVIIHGILHLCGLDDHTEKEEINMRNEEEKALNLLENLV
ncbi:MAG: rRNA maturation RNase YbeY [Fermentimonas sp.]|jgi:probable rRNA maturation factor